MNEAFEIIIGLEVHVQLNTQSKIFCGDSTFYGSAPNTLVSAISLGHPGTLPKINAALMPKVIRLGIALGCKINVSSTFDRKAYFYPDLPKGYQITQNDNPVLIGGQLKLEGDQTIRLHHAHLEEDAGKSIHHLHPKNTLLDYNRAGTPLLEIVTEPDFRSGEQVEEFLYRLRQLVRYLDISDGNMEQGSLRCDVNVSVRPIGQEHYNNRCEVKNVNSMKFARQAISYEAKRQIKIMNEGGVVSQNTLNFNPDTGVTTPLRSKEDAPDYRYFPDPDIPPLLITQKEIEQERENIAILPWEFESEAVETYGLSPADAKIISAEPTVAIYFLDYARNFSRPKAFANLLVHKILPFCKDKKIPLDQLALSYIPIDEMLALIENNTISISAAYQTLFEEMIFKPDTPVLQLAKHLGLIQSSNDDELLTWIDEVIHSFPNKVKAYQGGKKGLLGFFMGEIMKRSKGKANPKKTNSLLIKKLES
jgi:aspartyl-tRNA(Asn)/glutamyl-tRNA(Gln) amidotransferase subunit B